MTALGIALIVCGLALACGCLILRLFTTQEPASPQKPSEESSSRIGDEMHREQGEGGSEPADHVPNDRRPRSE
jgi:hypothetical protein